MSYPPTGEFDSHLAGVISVVALVEVLFVAGIAAWWWLA